MQLALLSCWAPVKSLAVTCVLADVHAFLPTQTEIMSSPRHTPIDIHIILKKNLHDPVPFMVSCLIIGQCGPCLGGILTYAAGVMGPDLSGSLPGLSHYSQAAPLQYRAVHDGVLNVTELHSPCLVPSYPRRALIIAVQC